MSFEIPLFELVITTLVTAAVTFVTIRISISSAAKETRKTIDAANRNEARKAVTHIAESADFRFGMYDWTTGSRSLEARLGEAVIRSSGLVGSQTALDWATEFALAATLSRSEEAAEGALSSDPVIAAVQAGGPSGEITTRLFLWLDDPKKLSPHLETDLASLKARNLTLMNERLALEEGSSE